ncbi:hypothetical protein PMIN06_004255 [Paraphaeosphaeria minitans]
MGLLDLPVELLRPIIRDIVLGPSHSSYRRLKVGCPPWANTDVISLARVNTVLETEVLLILEEARFLITNVTRPSSTFDLHPDYADFIARYVLIRPYSGATPWNAHFPALVDGVVDAIIQLRPQSAPLRTQMVTTLCRKASLHLLASKTVGDISWRSFNEHLLVAATHLKQLSVLAELLDQNPNLTHIHSDFFGFPVQAAIAADDVNLVRRLLLHGASFEHAVWLKDVVRARHAPRLLSVLTSQKNVIDVLRSSIRYVTDAIADAVELGKEDVAIALLQTQEDASGHGSMSFYLRKAVFEACRKSMHELLVLIIEAGAFVRTSAWTGPSLRHLLVAACKADEPAVLRMLLEKTKGLKTGVPLEDVLVQAMRTGTTNALRVLLDHGVRLSAVRAFKLLASVAPWPAVITSTPADATTALHHAVFLLEHKAVNLEALLAVEEHTGFGAAHLMMVAAHRGNFTLLEALARFGVPLDDMEFYAKAGCAAPVVAAEAYGREETAAKLRTLVVEKKMEAKRVVVEMSNRTKKADGVGEIGRGLDDVQHPARSPVVNVQYRRSAALASAIACGIGNGSRIRDQDLDDW